MSRGRWIAIGTLAVVAAAAVGIRLAVDEGGSTYPGLRQTRAQEIPGTLGWVLEPPPDGFDPALTPARALRLGGDANADRTEITMSLASVRDRLRGGPSIGTAWVVVNRSICVRTAKGELVSDARGDDPNDLGCTDKNLWVVAVGADDGRPMMSESAFDPTGTWAPLTGA